jgi:tetratricopeptide (TPR) repeat protein
MLRQFNRFLILAAIVAGALYITLTNSDPATIKLGPSLSLTTYAGVIYIAVFVLGCIAASVVALFFGFKGYLRERRLRSAEKARQSFLKIFERARALMAGGDWAAARLLWEEIIGRDEDNVIARVELSHCIEQLGDDREALRVLDATRASSRASSEVLFRAADLNIKMGNRTAANDNLSLILAAGPSHKALVMARDSSEQMERFDEALRYHEELEQMGYGTAESNEVRARILLRSTMKDATSEGAEREALVGFLKMYPQYVPALERLAELERKSGDIERAADVGAKCARLSGGDVGRWRAVVDLWLHAAHVDSNRRAERAVAATKAAAKDARGRVRVEVELLTIQTLLAVNHFQDAERLIDGFPSLAERELGKVPADLMRELTIQKGYCFSQMGKARDTGALWQLAAVAEGSAEPSSRSPAPGTLRGEPSPALSTP